MNIPSSEIILLIFTFVVSLGMGMLVWTRDRRSATNSTFLFLTLIFALWTVTNYYSLHSETTDATLFWIRIVMAVTTFLGPGLYFFLHTYPNKSWSMSRRATVLTVIAGVATSLACLTPYLFESVSITNGNISPKPGPFIILYLIVVLGTTTLGIHALYKKYRVSSGIPKLQIRYLFIGSVLTFSLFIISNIVFVLVFRSSKSVFLGPPFSLIMLGFISYTIIRHRFLNISRLVARAISYTLLVTIISTVYVLLFYEIVFVLNPALLSNRRSTVLVSALLALLIAVTLPKLQEFLEKMTDRVFYKDRYDEKQLFDLLANTITSTFDLDQLAQNITQLLHNQLRTSYTKIVLINEDEYIFFQSVGLHTKHIENKDMLGMQSFSGQLVAYDEISDGKLKEWMGVFELSLIVKLEVKHQIIGYLLLGEKSSGEIYYQNDLDILPIVADQLAIAFENALGVRQINRFNETLKQEVDTATTGLQEANEELTKLDKVKDEFLSMASHELKSPMNAIKNYLWMAQHKGKENPEKMDGYLNTAYNATQRLIALVNDLLDVSRIESGRVTLDMKPLNLQQVVSETIDIFAPQAKEKGLALLCDIEEGTMIIADDAKLREVLSNLISNAVKYTLTGSVHVGVATENSMVKVTVTDTGMGISIIDQQKLFLKFSRVNASYKELASIEGTGLGLWICKQFIEKMGGQIGMTSEVGKGSTFWFTLPKDSSIPTTSTTP